MKRRIIAMVLAFLIIFVLDFSCKEPDPGDGDPEPEEFTYTVTYNANGSTDGSVPTDSSTYEEEDTVTVLGNTGDLVNIPVAGTAEAFKFGCWNTQANGSGTDYDPSDTFSMGTADVVLYVKWVPFELRDTGPAGGLIFCDNGVFSNGWRYLEASLSDQSTSQVWIAGGSTQTTANGNTSNSIGTGLANSNAIISQTGHTGSAAEVCLDYDDGTYSDWFLPSIQALEAMYIELHLQSVGGFADASYWSSTEAADSYAWPVYFPSPSGGYIVKSNSCRVRAVRAF